MNTQQLIDVQPWILPGSLFLFLSLETLRPLVTPLQRGWHVLHNIGLLVTQVAINRLSPGTLNQLGVILSGKPLRCRSHSLLKKSTVHSKVYTAHITLLFAHSSVYYVCDTLLLPEQFATTNEQQIKPESGEPVKASINY